MKSNPPAVQAFFLSDTTGDASLAWVREYGLFCALNADPGSEFETLLRPHRKEAGNELIRMLLFTGYDGFVLATGRKVLGHVWYQRRQPELRVFSVWIAEGYRKALREEAVLRVISRARGMPGISRIRFGTELHAQAVSWIINWLQRKHGDIGIAGHQNGVVHLARQSGAATGDAPRVPGIER